MSDRSSASTSAERTPCAHCGLPVPGASTDASGDGPHFCCSGCRTVHSILHQAGYADSYYRLRAADSRRSAVRPPRRSTEENLLAELDSESFRDEHCSVTDGGRLRTNLFLDGVHCAACVWLVERVARETGGVARADLNLPRGRLTVEWDPDRLDLSRLARRLSRFGYPVQPRVDGPEAPESREERRLLIKAGVSWALAGNIMLIAFALYSGLGSDGSNSGMFAAARWLSMLLALPVVAVGGSVFFRRAWSSMRMAFSSRSIRFLHMDTPISLGILVGFGASAHAAVTGSGELWFDSIAILIAALITARWLQLRSRRLAGNSTERLLAMLPTMARRLSADGSAEMIPADDLAPGDRIVVLGGELIPADGVVADGSSHVDKSILTGESRPVPIGAGDEIFAGTTNVSGRLTLSVARTGEASRIGRLLTWVNENRGSPSDMPGVTDRIGGWFTAGVILLAAVTGLFWFFAEPASLTAHVVAVLVITCPCALGMAAPLSLAVGTGRAARRGAFIKNEQVIERLREVDTVVLDKTGTITEGRMTLAESAGDKDALRLAAALEAQNVHPIARAFTSWAEALPDHAAPHPENVESVPGSGLRGVVDGRTILVGSPAWVLDRSGVALPFSDQIRAWTERGMTPVLVAVDGRVRAAAAIADALRPDARAVIGRMLARGVDVRILSGDDEVTTRRIAEDVGLGVDSATGGAHPEEKEAEIRRLAASGRRVLMVGDGVNDAAALQTAHVGVAVAEGSSVSRMAADVYCTRTGISIVDELMTESSKVVRLIRRLLFLSAGYNLVGGLAAVAGLVTPLVAAVAMPISSFVVVISAARQRTFTGGSDER